MKQSGLLIIVVEGSCWKGGKERKKERKKTLKAHISRLQCTVKGTVEKEIGERQRKTEIVYIHRLKRLKVAIE
jgi:hypothetical protein